MKAMQVLLNVTCGSKVCDVLFIPERRIKTCKSSENKASDGERGPFNERTVKENYPHTMYNSKCLLSNQDSYIHRISDGVGSPFHERTVKENYAHTTYNKLKIGDPARNIIEMIFLRASNNHLKPSIKIKIILRLKNSIETLENFERYRDKVKKKSYYEQYKTNPRCVVDGNELLRFYGTTITCCSEKSTTQVSLPCKDMECSACRIVQSNFDTEHIRKNGILLSTSSEEVSDDFACFKKAKNIGRAVIVCRIVAGMTSNKTDEDYVSLQSEGHQSLIVRNPRAVLPCFIIVFSTT